MNVASFTITGPLEYPINRAGSILLSIWIKKNHALSSKKGFMLVHGPVGPRSAHILVFFTTKTDSAVESMYLGVVVLTSFWFVGLAQWIELTPIPRL